jgi:class 3 adenylate cyclase/tetratricopeptide (TPR) repeat protein
MDIGAWLKELGLERYAAAFEENAVDERVLPRLTGDDLKEIGVMAVGHRRILLDAISALSVGKSEPPESADGEEPGSERRQVSVLFADIVGYSALSSELDAEEVRVLLDAFFSMADQAVIGHGGNVDKHIGDCVMGVFGAPVAHGNDEERAVRAAIAIRDGAGKLAGKVGRQVRVHVGVASGEVVAAPGVDTHREYTVTGETVNLASRLADRATADEILVSASVHSAVAARISCEPAGAFELKGFAEPLAVWRVQQVSTGGTERLRPFVGRAAETRQIAAAIEGCATTGTGQTILVRGEPGIGKSRLAEEFRRLASNAGFVALHGLVLDFGGDKGRAAVATLADGLIRREYGPQAVESAKSLRAALAASGLDLPDQAIVFDLLDANMPEEIRTVFEFLDRDARQRHALNAMVRIIESVCQNASILLIVEDIHWADTDVLEILSAIAGTAAKQPVLLVVTTRPEGDPLRHGWIPGGPLMSLDLAPLSNGDARSLAESYFDAAAAQVEACVQRAAGNPLFLDQLLQHAQSQAQGAVPNSIQSLVQARMDQLPPRDKKALQTASVLGQTFTLETLRHLLDDPSFDCSLLRQRQLVRQRDDGFMFNHALIRDAAYGTLLRNRRRDLHKRAADWLADREPVLTAEHLALADDPEAPRACLSAAKSLAAKYRFEQALGIAERGLGVSGDREITFELEILRAEMLLHSGDTTAALDAFAKVTEAATNARETCRSLLGLASARRISDDLESALEDTRQATELAEAEGLTEDAARGYGLLGNLLFPRGDVEGCYTAHLKSLELAQATGSPELEASALGGLGDVEYLRGNTKEATQRFAQCVDLARSHNLRRTEVANMPMYAIAQLWNTNIEEVLETGLQAIGAAAAIGFDRAEMIGHHAAFFAYFYSDGIREALEHAERATALAKNLKAPRFEAEGLVFEAEVLFDLGRASEARTKYFEALAIGRRTGMAYMGPVFLGGCAKVAETGEELAALADEGEILLANDPVCHNHVIFRANLIDICLVRREWAGARYHAHALARYLDGRDIPGIRIIIERGLALAGFGESPGDAEAGLERIAAQLRQYGHKRLLRRVEAALEECRKPTNQSR